MQNDYIDFKFGDHWASEFNLLAVSSSDRYTPPVYGSVNPNIATIMGKKGVYKWKTQVNEKIFNINIAFDSVTIAQLNQIKQWLQPNKIQKLIFSEEPYKYYWAALNAEIDFSHLPFVEGEKQVGERTIIEGVYKGEMVISFVCIDNDGYSTEGTFEGLETENPSSTIKGNDFVLTDADNDYIEDLKIEGKSKQETKYNNTLSDTDFADVNSRSVEKAWKTNNLAQIQAENGEVTISAPYQYSGIAQEQREALIDHKYFASAEINTDSLDTALEIAGKNITNSIEGKDINITDGLVGPVDDLVVSGDASQDKLYNNEINSSFLEDLDNWEEINEAVLSREEQTAIIESDKKYSAAIQKTEESNIGDKYYLSAKIKADSVDTVLEVETEKGNAEGSNITINDASDNKMRDFKLYGKSQQDNYEEEVLGEGEYITYNNDDNYDKYTKIEISGNSAQEVIEEVLPTVVEGESITAQGITLPKGRIGVYGNSTQETRQGYNLLNVENKLTLKGDIKKAINLSPGTYTIKFDEAETDGATQYLFRFMKDDTTLTYERIGVNSNKLVFTLYDTANSVQIYSGTGYDESVNVTTTYKNLMIYAGTEDKSYEAYGKMPSPEYSSPIKVLGDNTNLFNALDNFSARTIAGLTVTPISNDSIIKINGTATADTFSFIGNDIIDIFENGKTYYAYTNNENFEVLFELYGVDVEVSIKTVDNFVMSSEYTKINLILKGKNLNGKTYNNEKIGIKIEEGKITNYTPYGQGSCSFIIANGDKTQKQEFVLPIQKPMLEGDYFDFKKGKEIHNWEKVILDGTEPWGLSTLTNYQWFRWSLSGVRLRSDFICTHLKTYDGIGSSSANYIGITNNSTPDRIYIAISKDITTVEQLKEYLAELKANNNPIVVYYQKTEIEELPLTEEQIKIGEQIAETELFLDTTNIYSNDEIAPNFKLEYNYVLPSPSPEVPSEIQNVEGNINITICNKNLCYKSIIQNNDNINFYFNTKSIAKEVTISFIVDKSLKGNSIYCKADGVSIGRILAQVTANANSKANAQIIFTDEEYEKVKNANEAYFQLYKGGANFEIINDPMIENSPTATNYVSHQEQNFTFPLAEGQKLMKGDYLARDGIHHVRKQIELNGIENIFLENSTLTNVKRFYIRNIGGYANPNYKGLCSHFRYIANYSLDEEHVYVTTAGFLYIFANFNSVDELKEYLAEQKANGTPVIVEYELAKEEIELYIKTQQEVYNNLTHLIMYNGQNTLSSSNKLKPQLKWKIPESPSPDYFIEIENVTGDIDITVCNKNLGNAELLYNQMKFFRSNSVRKEIVDGKECIVFNNSMFRSAAGFKGLLGRYRKQTRYVIRGKFRVYDTSIASGYQLYLNAYNSKDEGIGFQALGADGENWIQFSFATNSGSDFDYIAFSYGNSTLWCLDMDSLEIYEGTSAEEYAKNEEQLITFPLSEGQRLMKGSYLASDGIHHVRKQITVTEDMLIQDIVTTQTNLDYIRIKKPTNFIGYNNGKSNVSLMSFAKEFEDWTFDNVNYINKYTCRQQYLYFMLGIKKGTTYEEIKDKIIGQTIEYELAKEEIEPYTPEQQEAYNQLCTHREITYIQTTNKFQPNMQIEYTKKPQYQSQLTVANTQQTLSLIYQTNIDDTRILISNIDSNPNTIEFTNPVLINLTKTFGEGKEPTKDWCDQNLTFFKCEEGGAPSVETSSRVKTVGSNINLFDPDNHIELDGQYRHYSEGKIVNSANFFGIKVPVLGNTVYSVNSNLSRGGYSNLCYYNKDSVFMWGEPFTEGQTFRTPFNCRYITLALNKNYDWFTLTYGEIPIQKVDYNLANIDMQISGYDSQFKSFPLAEGQELLQLSDGTQDTLEADGIHKRVGKLIVTGNEKWGQYNRQLHTYFGAVAHIAGANGPIFCNRLINNNTYVYNTTGEAAACLQENYLYMCIKRKDFGANDNMSVDECLPLFRQFLKDEYSKGNPFIYYYKKAEEEIIPYSNAQKAWYDDFEIYRKNTQITTIAETKPWYSFTYDINDTYSVNSTKVNEYEKLGLIFNNLEDRPRFIVNRTADGSGTIKMRKPLVVDLTNAFGAGKEPDLAWCLENITFDNSCEYGTPSPNVPSELISVGSNPIKIENKSRNLIKEQNLLNWTKEYCTAERLTEKYNSRNIYRISFENHKKGTISTRIQQKKGDMVFSIYARVIQADNPTVNRLVVAKVTSDSSASTVVSHKSFENLIGEWQKIYIPITSTTISDAAELVLEVQHNADTDDSTVIDLCMPQLEEGFTPHDYIPYTPEKVNNLIFTTPLRQLKNGVRDELSKDGIIRRIGEHTIKSTDTVYWIVFNQDKDYVTICGKLGIYIRGANVWKSPSFYCNRIEDCTYLYAISQGGGTPSSRTKEGIGIIDSEYRMCLRADLMGIVETDTEEDMIRKYKVLLDEKPFTIYYEKEVADIEPLTELQKNTLANLVTRKQYDHWLISGDLNPEVELTYKLTSSINDIHPWVTGSNLLDKTWFYNDNNIHTKPYVEVDTGDADKSGISATRPIYLLNSGTETANLSLTFDYINIETPLTIQTYSGKFTDDGFVEEAKVSEITIEPFTNYQPFKDIYDNNPANWKIEIDSTLGEVYLRHNTDETKVLNLNRFNRNHTFLSLADCNFVDYDKVFPTIISEIEGTAIENTIFNKVIIANTADNYRLKNVNVEWKHTYL